MKRKLLVLVLGVCVFILLGFNFALADDYGVPDTVYLERIQTVSANSQVVYRLYIFNDHNAQGVVIPLTFPDTTSNMDISLDSVSWLGTRGSTATQKNDKGSSSSSYSLTDSANVINKNRLAVYAIWYSGYLAPVTRAQALATPVANVFFRTGSSWVSPNYVPVDTITIPPTNALALTDSNGSEYIPRLAGKGALDVNNITTPSLPTVFSLSQNYPNPFNATTTIEFDNPQKQNVKVDVLNILGQKVETLVEKELEQKRYRIDWNASGFPSGPYFCRVQAGNEFRVIKITLLK